MQGVLAVTCRAGLKQPSVEVRFDDLCASAMGPEGAADGLFTVGVDLQVKALVRPPACYSLSRVALYRPTLVRLSGISILYM